MERHGSIRRKNTLHGYQHKKIYAALNAVGFSGYMLYMLYALSIPIYAAWDWNIYLHEYSNSMVNSGKIFHTWSKWDDIATSLPATSS